MVKYSCEKCGKEFTQKGHYTKHTTKKNPCVFESKIEEMIEKVVARKINEIKTNEVILNKEIPKNIVENIKFIDLFCGIGSFHYSFKKLGWDCVMSCDIDNAVKETYKNNYGISPLGDITEIEPKNINNYDILCAGFPCQPFSQCGQHKGFDDKRGTLFFNIMKFIDYHKPKIIILENVMGLLNHDGGKTFEKIKGDIETSNYSITYKVIKCSDYGLPQMRKRLIIVGVRNDTALINHIDKLLDLDEYKKETTLTELLGKNFEKKIAYTIRCGGKNSPIDDKHNWDGYIVDGKEYRLTKEDCLKIQGFSSEFKLCGNNKDQWKQLGNTIPTIFTEIIGLNLKKYLMMSIKEGNKGEKDEIKYKKELFEKRMDIKYCTELFGGEAQEGIEVINIETGKPYEDITDIKKSKSVSKADTIIILIKTQKQLNISIKSKTGTKPSIINHTPRSANAFQNEYLKDDLCYLDILAKEYIDKRKQGSIGEDVELGKLSSYNNENVKNSLIKLLVYFTFKGTGSKISEHECNSVLIINKNGSLSFILCNTEKEKETYIQTIVEKSIISFRNKGMPKNTTEQCMPWVYVNDKGKECGAIHIRLTHTFVGNSSD